MAKNDNLKDFLTDVADAIREKKGTTDLINPQNFSEEILSIKSGGDGVVAEKDIRFYDYDGTLLYSYTIEEAQALKELPPLPSHEGLICQGWNWDYEDVIALDYPMNIGANYITDDGKTRLWIKIDVVPEHGEVTLRFWQSISNGVTVDWGDGSPTETFEGVNGLAPTHIYTKEGDYCVTLDPMDSCIIGLGSGGYGVFNKGSNSDNPNSWNQHLLRKAFIGKNYTNNQYGFSYADLLSEVSVPAYWTSMPTNFVTCDIKFLVIPKNCKTLATYGAYMCKLEGICFPNGIVEIPTAFMSSCSMVKSITLPESVTFIRGSAFYANYIAKISRLPSKLISIEQSAFQQNYAFDAAVLPDTCVSIGNTTFASSQCITKAILPDALTDLNKSQVFRGTGLKYIRLPKSAIILGQYFVANTPLEKLVLPQNLAEIKDRAFEQCYKLHVLKLPSTLETINQYAFNQCYAVAYYDFTSCNQVPTLVNTNAFSGIQPACEIRVPEDLYDEWKSATNWATYADYIKAYPRTEYDYDALMEKYYGKLED